MGVNGVELKVGQVWLNRTGQEMVIVDLAENWVRCASNSGSYYVYKNGKFWDSGTEDANDLIELVRDKDGCGACGDACELRQGACRVAEESPAPQPTSQEPLAISVLQRASEHMRDRAATYDKPGGERSMGKTIAAFNAVTGRDLREAEGWLLIQLLKDVRLFSAPGYHADSAEDCIAYAALKAEAKAGEVA